mmetsp:Transcript_56290/g.150667  ORF Transcript_56290/g.150667 Transcript_56290/m.150667 type:complete len:206 (+) Transcript_56290:2021-2638(+)
MYSDLACAVNSTAVWLRWQCKASGHGPLPYRLVRPSGAAAAFLAVHDATKVQALASTERAAIGNCQVVGVVAIEGQTAVARRARAPLGHALVVTHVTGAWLADRVTLNLGVTPDKGVLLLDLQFAGAVSQLCLLAVVCIGATHCLATAGPQVAWLWLVRTVLVVTQCPIKDGAALNAPCLLSTFGAADCLTVAEWPGVPGCCKAE